MIAWLQQYVLYALGGIIAIGAVSFGVQTIRLNNSQKDLLVVTADRDRERAVNLANKQTLDSIKKDGDELKARITAAQQDIIKAERRYSQLLEKLNKEIPIPTTDKCEDIANWAREVAIRKELE
jgi:acyl-coenzyme A synthetase/AMP-(fatty) acid ligase